jgi:uncharacterized protein YjbJ (UPF0337 family)
MDKDRVKGAADDVAGRVKRQVGEWTDNPNLQTEGAAQQIKGKAEKAWGNVKDAARDASTDVKNAAHDADNKAKSAAHDANKADDREKYPNPAYQGQEHGSQQHRNH